MTADNPMRADDGNEIASVEELAALEFEPLDVDLEGLPNAERINNPHMVSVRAAAVALTKSKPELIEIVRKLGGDRPDGGDLAPWVDGIHEATALFKHLLKILSTAEARLLSATSSVAVADGWADHG